MGSYQNWEEKPMRQKTRRRLFALGILAIVPWIVLVIWIFRLIPLPDQSASYPAKSTDLMAALTIVAVLIERVLEMLFSNVVSTWHTAVAYYSHGLLRPITRSAAPRCVCDGPGIGHQFAARARGHHEYRRTHWTDWRKQRQQVRHSSYRNNSRHSAKEEAISTELSDRFDYSVA